MKLLTSLRNFTAKTAAVATLSGFAVSNSFAQTAVCGGTGDQATSCDLDALKTNVASSIGSGINLIYLVSAIVGIGFIVAGIMKLKAHALDMQQTSGAGKHAVYLFIVGACLIAIPIIMLMASGSLFGSESLSLPSEASALNFNNTTPGK